MLFCADSVGQSLGIYLPTAITYRFIGLFRGIILTWLMLKSEFGLFMISLLAVNILNPLCSAGLNEAAARYVPHYETRQSLRPFLKKTVILVMVVSGVLCLTAFLAAEPLGGFLIATFDKGELAVSPETRVMLTRLVVVTTFALIGYFLLLSILKGLRMFRAVSLMELINNITFTLLAVIVALSGFQTATAVLSCYCFTLLAVIVLFSIPLIGVIRGADHQLKPLAQTSGGKEDNSMVKQMFRFSVWAALAAVMWQALQYYPMWYLYKVHGPEVQAVFGGVRHITQAVLIGAVAIVTVVQASVTKTWESRGTVEADRQLLVAYKSTALLLVCGCVVVSCLSDIVIRLLHPGFSAGAEILPLLLMFFLIGGHLAFLAIHFALIEKTRYMFWPWAIGVAGSVGLGHFMIRPGLNLAEALNAAAWSGVLAITISLLGCFVLIVGERRPMGMGACLLLASTYTLVLPNYLLIPAVLLVLILAWFTNVVFSHEEKQTIGQYAAAGRNKIRQIFSATSA
jgi:O-antigen/teichoic acid export membrane protein